MKIYNTIFKKINTKNSGIISIGYFDAMHIGHKKIISELVRISRKTKKESFIMTFSDIPHKNNKYKKILPIEDKIKIFKDLGIKNLIISAFDKKITGLSPRDFMETLKNNFNISSYVVSKDFKFGHKKHGNIETLKKFGAETYFIKPATLSNKIISTSMIKALINDGKINEANSYLGYRYNTTGKVIKFKQLGRTIGFPTMNIINNDTLLPKNGVYLTKTLLNSKKYDSMTYINNGLVETHLLKFNKFQYNMKIRVDFLCKIRDNAIFKDLEHLKIQLEKDLLFVKEFKEKYNDNNR